MKRWDKKELDFLVKFYPTQGPQFCEALLNRSVQSIKMKASRLGLKYSKQNQDKKVSEEDYKKALENTNYFLLGEYKGSTTKTLHRHIVCGNEWEVTPNNLKKLSGCPSCSKSGFSIKEPAFLYLVYFPEIDLYKVGVTKDWNRRKYDFKYKPELILLREFKSGKDALKVESEWLENLKSFLFNSELLKSGNTETFIYDPQALSS